MKDILQEVERGIVRARFNYAKQHSIPVADVCATIGVAQEIHSNQSAQCYRFQDPATYPNEDVLWGTPTPRIYAKNQDQILLAGLESQGAAAAAEAHGACCNTSARR